MFRTVLLTLILVAGGACAQAPPGDTSSDRSEEQPLQLPEDMLGVWMPQSEGYTQFGNLTIERDVLTWGTCSQAPYRVLRMEERAIAIQVSSSASCTFVHGGDLLIINSYDDAYVDAYTKRLKRNIMHAKVSVCEKLPEQLNQPHEHAGRCISTGVLYMVRP